MLNKPSVKFSKVEQINCQSVVPHFVAALTTGMHSGTGAAVTLWQLADKPQHVSEVRAGLKQNLAPLAECTATWSVSIMHQILGTSRSSSWQAPDPRNPKSLQHREPTGMHTGVSWACTQTKQENTSPLQLGIFSKCCAAPEKLKKAA